MELAVAGVVLTAFTLLYNRMVQREFWDARALSDCLRLRLLFESLNTFLLQVPLYVPALDGDQVFDPTIEDRGYENPMTVDEHDVAVWQRSTPMIVGR